MKAYRKEVESVMSLIYDLNERETQILDLFMEDSSLTASRLSEMLSVSSVTIRSDLSSLEEKGFLVRTHGGALPAFHPEVLERMRTKTDIKRKLAKAAAAQVKDGATIMIEAGSTTALIARYLMGKRGLHIVTDSTLLLPYVRVNPSIQLTLVGGTFNSETESMVGSIAIKQLRNFHVDLAFIGADGFSFEKGLTSNLTESAEVIRCMHENSDKIILVADSTKEGRTGFARALPLNKIDLIITDDGISSDSCKRMSEEGISLQVVNNKY